MDQAEIKSTSDHSAADYLKQNRGMKLASDDINLFQFKMEDIKMRGAIGTGSYGEVYKAEVNGGQVVAVKKLHVRNLKAEQVDAFCKVSSLFFPRTSGLLLRVHVLAAYMSVSAKDRACCAKPDVTWSFFWCARGRRPR